MLKFCVIVDYLKISDFHLSQFYLNWKIRKWWHCTCRMCNVITLEPLHLNISTGYDSGLSVCFNSHVGHILCWKFRNWWLQNEFEFTSLNINSKHVQANQILKYSQFDFVYAVKYCDSAYSNWMCSVSVFMPAAALHFLLAAHVSVLLLYALDFLPPVCLIMSISLHDCHSCSPYILCDSVDVLHLVVPTLVLMLQEA
jgi:hypothetical protein